MAQLRTEVLVIGAGPLVPGPRGTPTEWPQRSSAADLALARGEQMLAYKRERLVGADEMQKAAWRAVLAAVPDRPEAVRTMAMTLCGKSPDPHGSEQLARQRRRQ
jgi:hypothetical protein